MLALEEKARTVVLIRPEQVLSGQSEEIVAKLEDQYMEVKARKQVYLLREDSERFFHYLPDAQRAAFVEAYAKGLSEVLVLEHLDGDAISRMRSLAEELQYQYGPDSIYRSESQWESMRDVEFFFPHLDAAPVERTLVLVKPDGITKGFVEGLTLEQHIEAGLANVGCVVVGKQKRVLGDPEAELLCAELRESSSEDFRSAVTVLKLDPGVIAMCIEGPGAVAKALLLAGPTSAAVAKNRAPTTFRACWGTDTTSNAVHASASLAAAERELKALFPPNTLQLQRTLCIVKPHAMRNLLDIRMEIEAAGFTVLKEKQTTLSEERAKEFFRDHKDKAGFGALVREACAGTCSLMVLCRLEAVSVWQQLMGPEAVREAKVLRPRSVRARYGEEAGMRNAVHGSETPKAAAWEVRYFFPEMGADPIPGNDEVRDFLFRKAAGASMDLKSLSPGDGAEYNLDPTLQQLISSGLLALCQVRPKGLAALTWFADWLEKNNPNTAKASAPKVPQFYPPDRTQHLVEYGVNPDGLPFSVEAPAPQVQRKVVEVDVSTEPQERRSDFRTPPHVVFVLGGSGSGSVAPACDRLCEDFNLVLVDTAQLLQEEVAARGRLSGEILKCREKGLPVPDKVAVHLLKRAMLKRQETNRFLLRGFPQKIEQAALFEEEVAAVAFAIHFQEGEEAVVPPDVQKLVEYYGPVGKVRPFDATLEPADLYKQMRKSFLCHFIYLIGPPGAPVAKVAEHIREKHGYCVIDVTALLDKYAQSGEKDAAKVKQAIAKGKPVAASVACPLVLAEISREMASGSKSFVICDFPQSAKQVEFLQFRIPCIASPLFLDFTRADAYDIASTMCTRVGMDMRTAAFFSNDTKAMIAGLRSLVRIPCALAEVESGNAGKGPSTPEGLEHQLVGFLWGKVEEKVAAAVIIAEEGVEEEEPPPEAPAPPPQDDDDAGDD